MTMTVSSRDLLLAINRRCLVLSACACRLARYQYHVSLVLLEPCTREGRKRLLERHGRTYRRKDSYSKPGVNEVPRIERWLPFLYRLPRYLAVASPDPGLLRHRKEVIHGARSDSGYAPARKQNECSGRTTLDANWDNTVRIQ